MASRSAGTLITHNNATYRPPALMPGYHGYVPTAKFTYGDTYGNTTLKSFQDFRSQVLKTSHSPYSTGGHYPTMYSHDPSLVIASRSRDRDRMLLAPYVSKNNMDSNRQQVLTQFEKMAQKHMVSYNDKTGTVQPVKYFILPIGEGEGFPQRQDIRLTSVKKNKMASLPFGVHRYQTFTSGVRTALDDRTCRDVFFESR